jgi:uncharacterized protein
VQESARTSRLAVVDALRGFALCGILLINLPHMGWLMAADEPVRGVRDGGASTILWWIENLLVSGTMRGLFSLLFGASMLLFLAKAERGSATPSEANQLMLRRLFWLFMFGVLDATLLLWPGDILQIYAMAGLLVLPFATARPRKLAISAAIVIAALSAFMVFQQWPKRQIIAEGPTLQARVAAGQPLSPSQQKDFDRWNHWQTGKFATPNEIATERAVRLGGYGGNLAHMSKLSWEWLIDWKATVRWVLDAVGFMLVGMLLFRLRWLQAEASRRTYLALIGIGYGAGLPLKAIGAVADWRLLMGEGPPHFWQFWLPAAVMQAARLLVTFGHLGLFLWCWKTFALKFAPLQALGRMAFSYLLQSALGALAFSGFGLALWGRLSLVELWGLAAAIWAIEIVLAMSWLARFSMGPFERVWRALTYGWRLQPKAAIQAG